MRIQDLGRRLQHQQKIVGQFDNKRYLLLVISDVVLVQRYQQANKKGYKLEPRQDGPFILDRLTAYGKSRQVKTLYGEAPLSKYYINDIKKFIPIEDSSQKYIAQVNLDVKKIIKDLTITRRIRKAKNEQRYCRGLEALLTLDYKG